MMVQVATGIRRRSLPAPCTAAEPRGSVPAAAAAAMCAHRYF